MGISSQMKNISVGLNNFWTVREMPTEHLKKLGVKESNNADISDLVRPYSNQNQHSIRPIENMLIIHKRLEIECDTNNE